MWTTSDFENILPETLYKQIKESQVELTEINEIRIRRNRPACIVRKGEITELKGLGSAEFDSYFMTLCKHSPYAYSEEIKNGYLTIKGGHRVGICGQAVFREDGLCGLNYISSLNIRIHRERIGCIKKYVPYLTGDGRWHNTLIVSVPGAGKTTLLRDLVREASDGNERMRPYMVSLVDERNEIAASVMGNPEMNVGKNTDILTMSNKTDGILMMLRSMSPEIIAFDELGGEADYSAVRKAVYSGVIVFATIHGRSRKNLEDNPYMKSFLQDGIFERIAYLDQPSDPGHVISITDSYGNEIMEEKERLK